MLDKGFILTAAHCIDGQRSLFVSLGAYNKSNPIAEYVVSVAVIHRSYNRFSRHSDIGLLKLSTSVVYNGFVITNARGLPRNAPLVVGVMGMWRSYKKYRVDAVFKHPEYSEGRNDIALLRLNRPVTHTDGMKPICVLVNAQHQKLVESSPFFTVFDYVEIEVPKQIYAVIVTLIQPKYCSYRIRRIIYPDQFCLKYPRGMSLNYGKPGDLLGGNIMLAGKKRIVKLGAYNRSQPTAQYNVLSAIRHPLYNNFRRVHDVGLLKLANIVVFNAFIHPICIILNHNIKSLVELTRTFKAFGWGEKGDGNQSDILQAITLNHLQRADCHRRLGMNLTQQQICAGVHNGDTCRGDSGGPLTNNVSLNNASVHEVQFGIISYGTLMCNDTGVYTDVSSYVDWIKKSIVKDMWLYSDCGGESIASNFQANIIGLDFKTQGVLITDRFVISNARDLRGSIASLKVIVIGLGRAYGEYKVDSVFKHQKCSDKTYDIALLRLNGSVTYRGN
ncbi:hypothetical protein M5D96_009730, partial [Drosophila gunungcola]